MPALAHAADFVPLTSIPNIAESANSQNLSIFLNSIYKICIGLAGVLAVLQIVRGGMTYMLGDSVTEKREARHHITLAVFGLILVLAPAIVFGIIDPRILSLQVDTSVLAPTQMDPGVGPDQPVDGALSDGHEFPDGSSVSCLYPGGGQGNKIGVVVAHVYDQQAFLSVRFEGETTPRYVAPGDCHGYQADASDTSSVGNFKVHDSVWCPLDPPKYSFGTVQAIDTTRGWIQVQFQSSLLQFGAGDCFKQGSDAEVQMCGTAPNCKTGCEVSTGASGDLCEPSS
jgi:hypothetical protein